MEEDYYEPQLETPLPPIVCHDCGKSPMRIQQGVTKPEGGEIIAREMGWKGFSRLRDSRGRTIERLGCCPECQREPAAV